jgi:hypothetical protein
MGEGLQAVMVDLGPQTRSYQKDSRQHSLGQRHGYGIGRVAFTLFPEVSCPVGQCMALPNANRSGENVVAAGA